MSKMDKKVGVIGAVDLGKITANMIEVNKGVEINPAFAPEPIKITAPPTMPLFNQDGFYLTQSEWVYPHKTNQKKFRKHNNRKKKRRK